MADLFFAAKSIGHFKPFCEGNALNVDALKSEEGLNDAQIEQLRSILIAEGWLTENTATIAPADDDGEREVTLDTQIGGSRARRAVKSEDATR